MKAKDLAEELLKNPENEIIFDQTVNLESEYTVVPQRIISKISGTRSTNNTTYIQSTEVRHTINFSRIFS